MIAIKTIINSSKLNKFETEILLCEIIGIARAELYAFPERILTKLEYSKYQKFLARRIAGEPIAYIIGNAQFYGAKFKVNNSVLIPRMETEILIDNALNLIPDTKDYKILDLGTGSGIIAITLARLKNNCIVTAVDKSKAALKVAVYNAEQLNVNVRFIRSDWYQDIPDEKFNMIVSNPPYIAEDDPHLQTDIRFEPQSALVAKQQGLSDIKQIIEKSINHLPKGGILILEHGYNQSNILVDELIQYNFSKINTYKDLNSINRGIICIL